MCGGLLLLAAALAFTVYNVWDARRAAQYAQAQALQIRRLVERQAVPSIQGKTDAPPILSGEAADTAGQPRDEMPVAEIDGNQYIGTLSIPALGLLLPVMNDWSDDGLKLSPCRYSGSAYQGDLIVAAHNYPGHFGRLKELAAGDDIVLTDTGGNRFHYTVTEMAQMDGDAVEEMKTGEWDLTLFTCTVDGKGRVAVRCKQCGKSKTGMADGE